jgi:protein O-GlcNAc transferase
MANALEVALLKAKSASKKGDHQVARQIYQDILRSHPNNARARQGLEEVCRETASAPSALPREAAKRFGQLLDTGQFPEAVVEGEALLARFPRSAEIWTGVAMAQGRLGRFDRAIEACNAALAIRPDHAATHEVLGNMLLEQGRNEAAIAAYSQALARDPTVASAHNNLGNAFSRLGRLDEAIASYRRAVATKRDYLSALHNLGGALSLKQETPEAVEVYTRALAINPAMAGTRVHKLHAQAHICDWSLYAELDPTIGTEGPIVVPFGMLSFDDDAVRQRQRAERWAATHFPWQPSPMPRRAAGDRIPIGYFSSDFYNHATLHLMLGFLTSHDRSRFEVRIYSYGDKKSSGLLERLREGVEHFIDIQTLSDEEIVTMARRDGLDIAVDLKGYTFGSRTAPFAHRLAPIQINYMGYPGTMGAPFIDYIVGDHVLIPQDLRAGYTEKVIFMPRSYWVADDRLVIADDISGRADHGLPENGFVFCCFNATYKITPAEFDVWMRLLTATEGSVLWLLKSNDWVTANLTREAVRRGVSPDRLIFADKMPNSRHIARHRHADLFLDTFKCNAHTTTSEALWGGLPVLTRPGSGFASRVAASLLHAIDLPELVVDGIADYEALALALASDPPRLAAIRARLWENRSTAPLFDTALTTRHFEAACEAILARHLSGRPPEDLEVPYLRD